MGVWSCFEDPVRQARIFRPDSLRVWDNQLIRDRLSWYYRVMRNEAPAKFIIVKSMPVELNPYEASQDADFKELMRIHGKVKEDFIKLWGDVRNSGNPWSLVRGRKPKNSFLDLKIVLARKLASPCRICERSCRVRRDEGEVGGCRVRGLKACVDTYFHHIGEEAPLVPSGTIFYAGCNFRCVYCQNWSISQPSSPVGNGCLSAKDLAAIQEWLRVTGARNINHVGGDPTPYLPVIIESLKYLDINVPQLWNSNMYLTEDAMSILEDLVDIWLPDLKYGSNECARKLSGIERYVEVVRRNISRASNNGDMIVRHLVLPGHLECCTKPSIEWLARNAPNAVLNIMDQYHPDHLILRGRGKWGELGRRVNEREMSEAFRIARELGYEGPIEDLWVISS